jgi:hypothetical protein
MGKGEKQMCKDHGKAVKRRSRESEVTVEGSKGRRREGGKRNGEGREEGECGEDREVCYVRREMVFARERIAQSLMTSSRSRLEQAAFS